MPSLVLFLTFFVLTVIWCSTSFTVILKYYSWGPLMYLLVGGSDTPGNVLKTWKNFKFWRCIQVWHLERNCCRDVKEGNWIRFFFDVIVLVYKVVSLIGIRFLIGRQAIGLKFLCIQLLRKRLQLNSKLVWLRIGRFWMFFCYNVSSTPYACGLKIARIANIFPLRTEKCLIFSSRVF